jgi:hypothetical protein
MGATGFTSPLFWTFPFGNNLPFPFSIAMEIFNAHLKWMRPTANMGKGPFCCQPMTAGPLFPFLSSWLHFPSSSRDGLHRRNVPVDQLGFNANKKGSRWIMWRRKVAVQSFGHSSLILHSFIIHFLLSPPYFPRQF